jgi:hypothetical protein
MALMACHSAGQHPLTCGNATVADIPWTSTWKLEVHEAAQQ